MRNLPIIISLFAIVCLFVPQHLRGATKAAPLAVTFHRTVVALNDGWWCAVDRDGAAPRALWAGTMPDDASEVALPLCWEHHPLKRNPETVEWYWRRVTYPARMASTGARLLIENPVGMLEVYIDGKAAGAYLGNGLTRQLLLQGAGGSQHLLALRLDRSALPEAIRRGASCGLGPITLELLPPVRIASCVALPDAGGNTLLVHYCLEAEEPFTGALHLQILSPTGRVTQQTVALDMTGQGLEGERKLSLGRCPRWSPEDAQVCTLRVTLLCTDGTGDMCEKHCGASICKFAHGKFYVDGQPVLLKGMRLPGGIPLLTASLEQTLEHELTLLRRTGFNSLMADGAALPEQALTVADRLGIMVIGDIPPGADDATLGSAVEELGSHPSLVAWSWKSGTSPDSELAILRKLDPNRAVLLRNGAHSQILLPTGAGIAFDDEDIDGTPTMPQPADWPATIYRWEGSRQPVLVSGFCLAPAAMHEAAGAPASAAGDASAEQGGEGENEAVQAAIRTVVESVRRSETSLGYFVRPLHGGSLTGLTTGSEIPTVAFTDAMGYNAQDLIVLRDARTPEAGEPSINAVIINDSHFSGHYQLYQVLTSRGRENDHQTG